MPHPINLWLSLYEMSWRYFTLLPPGSFTDLALTFSCMIILINFCTRNEVDDQDSFCPYGHPIGPASFTEKDVLSPLHCSVTCHVCKSVCGFSTQSHRLPSMVPIPYLHTTYRPSGLSHSTLISFLDCPEFPNKCSIWFIITSFWKEKKKTLLGFWLGVYWIYRFNVWSNDIPSIILYL